ncbi:MAG: transposase [candidate division WOR-3 bacterium]
MEEPNIKRYPHNPPHIYLDDSYYFITASTLYKRSILITNESKQILKDIIENIVELYNFLLIAWVILPNHYHLLLKTGIGNYLPEIFRKIHSKSTVRINKILDKSVKIWYNYWDECVRNEDSLYKHFNYIHMNPVKHGYVKKPEDYDFSSYKSYLFEKGQEWLDDIFRRFPIIDFSKYDDF